MMTSKPKAPVIRGSEFADLVARYDRERLDHLRQIDLLGLKVRQYRQLADDAQARASMLQARMDRHMAHCDRDEGAVQRLKAELQEANSRRKEQGSVIARREERIASLLAADKFTTLAADKFTTETERPRLPIMFRIPSFLRSKIDKAAR